MWLLPTDLDKQSLYILQTESQSMNSYFKKWKVTCCHMMISCHLPILLLKLKWYTHLCKGCGMLFQIYRSCVNFSLIYCERWLALPLRYLSIIASFTQFFLFFFSFHNLFIDAVSLADLLNDLRQLICILFCIFS